MSKKRGSQADTAKKARGRTAQTFPSGQGTETHVDMQRQIRNFGSNRTVGSADHLHRGDRRDLSGGHMK